MPINAKKANAFRRKINQVAGDQHSKTEAALRKLADCWREKAAEAEAVVEAAKEEFGNIKQFENRIRDLKAARDRVYRDLVQARRELAALQPISPLLSFEEEHAAWSRETFGPDEMRGPAGPLRHLAKEAIEAAENPEDVSEFADCFMLLLDGSRRAGWSLAQLVRACQDKLAVNKAREWPPFDPANADEPIEHTKEAKP